MTAARPASIRLDGVGVDFTLYQGAARLLRKEVLRAAVGGLIGTSESTGRTIVRALSGIDLHLVPGDRLALVGHNGAGKTTLLRVLAGIYPPTQGSIDIKGACVPLFDISLGLDDEATGRENIRLRGLVMGIPQSELAAREDDIAAFSGLGKFLDLPVRTYSTGMILRLLFAIATSVDADILLMDEWLTVGDQAFMAQANQRLVELVDRVQILALASHDLDLLARVCNRALWLEAGSIKMAGKTGEVLAAYAAGRAP